MLILSDDFADTDLIGHAAYRDGLVEVIRSVESGGSFSIGIYGQWGLGKTSMMKQMKEAFDNPISKDDKPVITVWFNPWQFVADEHLIIPFFHTLIESLNGIDTKSAKNFTKCIRNVPWALAHGAELEIGVPLIFKAKINGSKLIEHGQKDESFVQNETENYKSTYYNLIQILENGAALLDSKIVVFIDDLDRCLPEKAVQLLEGLKVLLDLPNFVFVMGVAQEVIERGIRVRYKDLYIAGQENNLSNIEVQYLDKIIQFPFTLPAANPDELKQNILTKNLEEMGIDVESVNLIHEVLGSNPRTQKRFINTISFSLYLAEKKIGDFHYKLLIKISLIGYLFPSLYRQLEKYPGHLVRLEEIATKVEHEREIRKDEEDRGIFEGQSHQDKKTGLPSIDQWLEDEKFSKLLQILRIRDIGFKDKETVNKYIRLMASSLQSEVTSKAKDTPVQNRPVFEYMQDRMVRIPAGEFTMGDKKSGRREVKIYPSFLMDKYPVTQDLYQKVMHKNPSHFKGKDRPVENITWFDAIEFCNELSNNLGLQEFYDVNGDIVPESDGYRLPTEAQWEYACRANTTGKRYGELDEIAWYDMTGHQTQGVGQKKANDFGLYDVLGNVWEWCYDWYGDYPKGSEDNPIGPNRGLSRIMRGGSWVNFASTIRSSHRSGDEPNVCDYNQGFRLVLPLNQKDG